MSIAGDLVARLAKEGIDPTLLSEVAEALFTGEIETRKLADRRKNERERKARSRDVTGQSVTDAEVTAKVPSEVSPAPLPTNLQTSPLSPPIVEEENRQAVGSCLRKAFPPSLEIPDWVPDSYLEFRAMRKRMRNVPFEAGAERRCIAKLERLRGEGHDPEKLISKAIENGHRTFFPDDTTRSTASGKVELTAQQLRERAEWFIKHGQQDRADECRRKAVQLEQRQVA